MNSNHRLAAVSASLISLLLAFGHPVASPAAGPDSSQRVTVRPKETDELLANPGMGWQTFHRFADEDRSLAGLPSASAYFRFYWREIEPKDAQLDFARFDDLLAHARRVGQKLAFRVMCTGSGQYMDVPAWLKEQGCRGFEFTYGGGKHWVPDFADPLFQQAHYRMISQLGAHYDGHPDLDLLDIGSIGLWGEWHMSGTTDTSTGKPVPLPPVGLRLAIIDAWCRAFPKTTKVIQIGSEEGMSECAKKGCGWRADCLGDMGGFSKTWNHMENFYLQQVAKTGAEDAWKTGPIAFESCWDMRKWKESGWDIRYIYDYALKCHASYMNNKSAPLPEGTRGEVERFLRRLGYRLVVRTLEHDASVRAGSRLEVKVQWENLGAAPPYGDYFVAFQLERQNDPGANPVVLSTKDSIQGWLPGARTTAGSSNLPGSLKPGPYVLKLGLVGPRTQTPAIRLAIAGRDNEGWYPLSRLEIVQ